MNVSVSIVKDNSTAQAVVACTEIIMLTIFQNTEHIFNALAAGAAGNMLKQMPAAEVLTLLAKGYLYKGITMQLGLAHSTIHTHIRNIYKNLMQVHAQRRRLNILAVRKLI